MTGCGQMHNTKLHLEDLKTSSEPVTVAFPHGRNQSSSTNSEQIIAATASVGYSVFLATAKVYMSAAVGQAIMHVH